MILSNQKDKQNSFGNGRSKGEIIEKNFIMLFLELPDFAWKKIYAIFVSTN